MGATGFGRADGRAAVAAMVLALLFTASPGPVLGSDMGSQLRELVLAEDHVAALKLADEILAGDPASVEAARFRAYSLHRLGRHGDAEAAYLRALELSPESAWAWTNLAELYASRARFWEAVEAAEKAIELDPKLAEARLRLSWILREVGDYGRAAETTTAALEAGIDPAKCHAELGYIAWAVGDVETSRAHWEKARAAGADAAACAHGLRLLDWEKIPGTAAEQAAILARRRGEGPPWVLSVGGLEVHTRVGPALPRELTKLMEELADVCQKFYSTPGRRPLTRLFLSRTVEEHERFRSRLFPQGYSGKAFYHPSGSRFGGGAHDLYVAYGGEGLERSLSHELSHVFLHQSVPGGADLPPWLDEGLATWFELHPDEKGRLRSGAARPDLVEVIAEAGAGWLALDLEAILDAPKSDFQGPRARLRYAQSWALVHFLLEGRPDGRSRMRRCIESLSSGSRPSRALFTDAFGADLPRLATAWRRHIANL